MKLKAISLISILPLLLTSCGFRGDTKVYRNGELYFLDEITYENAFVMSDYNLIDSLIKIEETFMFYFKSEECYSCLEFKDIITQYVKETNQHIYIFDEITQHEDFVKLGKNYGDFFFPLGVIETPQLYVFSKEKACLKISNSKYATMTMFRNAMKETVSETNVYKVSSLDTLERFIKLDEEVDVFPYSRLASNSVSYFKDTVKDIFEKNDRKSIIFEYDYLDETGRTELKEKLEIESLKPSILHFKNGIKQ